ncbi:MAG: aminotransferase class I/II-fold pyridoxal phosphate-dependent enzyme [Clostridium sp.]|nr:aminotransferase class I/II-fold pyridoxal phosphate-dependent enzyme [Acetatifactor muris]MCM1527234.1 aminotransferase class I/II-fold pyridoxal phosphate-dependent enzyme [Bacteroides sp.]MCM1563071.1 aminotransferase class I/II-fold pyridoxal phosphate-dependent enzyme [Clostridium sp.]
MAVHGGDIYRNKVTLDFSINVNPLGMPEEVRAALRGAVDRCVGYPDPEADDLTKSVSAYLSVPKEYLLFGNGASELLSAIVHGIRPRRIVIPVPSFYGYEYAAGMADGEIVYHEMKREDGFGVTEELLEVLTEDVDMVFLANPNNPVGNVVEEDLLRKILRHCGERGIYVVLDECFAEFVAAGHSGSGISSGDALHSGSGLHSLVADIDQYSHLIVLRAFTKIFAIPGVRLGYLVCSDRATLGRIRRQLPEWNLSCFAQAAGCVCAEQTDFVARTQKFVAKERLFLEEGLRRKGIRTFPAVANFILCYSERPLYEHLSERGILIRDCSNFRGLGKGFYRIAVRDRKENEILLENL